MHNSPENRYNNQNPIPSNIANQSWDSLRRIPFRQIDPSIDQLEIITPSKRQQDKLIKTIITNSPVVLKQPTAQVYPEEHTYVSDRLTDESFVHGQLRNTISKIRPPYETKSNEEIFVPIFQNKHMSRILAANTEIGFENYQKITSAQIHDFLDNYPSPIDFEDASNSFLKNIGQQNSPEEYQEYLGAMHEFKHRIYGKQQEYWDQAKLLRQTQSEAKTNTETKKTLSLTPEIILQNSIIDGSPYSMHGQEYTLTPNILKQAGLGPNHEINVENRNIFLSDVFKIGNRNAAIAYVQDQDGNFKVRSYYQSNSAGLWRYLPDYVAEEDGYPSWFGKAYGEDSITLPYQIQKTLNAINQNSPIEIQGIIPPIAFFGTAKKYPSKFVYEWLKRQNQLSGDFYQEVSRLPSYNFGKLSIEKAPPESLIISPSFSPNFLDLISSSSFDSSLYPNATSELYPSYNNKLLYNMCSIQKKDHTEAWISNIETTSPITSTGCHVEWISTGDFGTPLYEYIQQANGYGDLHDSRGSYVNMYPNFLSKTPIIRRYLHETNKS